MKYILAVMVLVLATAGSALGQTPQTPTLSGLYSQSESGYTKMEMATSSGFKTSGVAKSAFSYGIAHVHGKWTYNGKAAAAQISSQPTFVLVSQVDVSTQSVGLVRFDVKKDRREAEMCDADMWTGVNTGNKDIVPLTVTRISGTNNLLVKPTSPLPVGEYLLITDAGKGYDGYDFSVAK